MSRVTVGDLYREYCDDEKWQTLKDIEVVPRKMVEMIIKKCEDTIRKQEFIMDFYASDPYISSNAQAARINTMQLKEYAESLLKQFEEEDKE